MDGLPKQSIQDGDISLSWITQLHGMIEDPDIAQVVQGAGDNIKCSMYFDKDSRIETMWYILAVIEKYFMTTYQKTYKQLYIDWLMSTHDMCFAGGYGHSFYGTMFYSPVATILHRLDTWPHHWCVRPERFEEFKSKLTPDVKLACFLYSPISVSQTAKWEVWGN